MKTKQKTLNRLTTEQLKDIVKDTDQGIKAGSNRRLLIKACRSIGIFSVK